MTTTDFKSMKLPAALRYSVDELAEAWGVSPSYVWQQIEAGRLRAVARGRQGKWHQVDPSMGQEIDFGSKGICGGSVVILTKSDGSTHVVHSEEIEWNATNVRILHKEKTEFEGNSVKEAALHRRAETAYLNIIGALLEYISGKIQKVDKHQSFDNETKLIELLDHHYKGIQGVDLHLKLTRDLH